MERGPRRAGRNDGAIAAGRECSPCRALCGLGSLLWSQWAHFTPSHAMGWEATRGGLRQDSRHSSKQGPMHGSQVSLLSTKSSFSHVQQSGRGHPGTQGAQASRTLLSQGHSCLPPPPLKCLWLLLAPSPPVGSFPSHLSAQKSGFTVEPR